MKKYVFKDQAVENAFRFIAGQFEIQDFDKQIEESFEQKTPYVSIYKDYEEKPAFTISTDLFESIEVYDPNGWNDRTVMPPQFAHFRYSQPYLVETSKGHFVEGVFDFETKEWRGNRDNNIVDCSRYREMPVGFFRE